MTASTNKPGRKGKGRQYRMMRVRIDTWNKLATYTAGSPAADPCGTHTGTPLESPDYCLACDLRLDRAVLSLLRENEPVAPVEDAPIKRHVDHNSGGHAKILFRPRNDAELKSAMGARQGGHCVYLCDHDWPGIQANCARCRRNTKTDTEYCQCCGDSILDRMPDNTGDSKARHSKHIKAKNDAKAFDMDEREKGAAMDKAAGRKHHRLKKERRWK